MSLINSGPSNRDVEAFKALTMKEIMGVEKPKENKRYPISSLLYKNIPKMKEHEVPYMSSELKEKCNSAGSELAKIYLLLNTSPVVIMKMPKYETHQKTPTTKIRKTKKVSKSKHNKKVSTDPINPKGQEKDGQSTTGEQKKKYDVACQPSQKLISWLTKGMAGSDHIRPTRKGSPVDTKALFDRLLQFWKENVGKGSVTSSTFPLDDSKIVIHYGFTYECPCYHILRDLIIQLAVNLKVEDPSTLRGEDVGVAV